MSKILVIGSINMDLILQVPHLPVLGETIRTTGFQTAAGGKGFNQAVAIRRMGSETAFYGYLGKDDYGKSLKEQLLLEGIEDQYLQISEDKPTGMAFILLDSEGRNSIVVEPGSNMALNVNEIKDILAQHTELETLVLQMEIPIEVVKQSLKEGKRLGKKVILNPSPYQALEPKDLEGLDTLVLNEIEAHQMTGRQAINEQITLLQAMGIRQIILTMGSEGVYYNDGDQIKHQGAFPTKVVDTTGAGDTFLGTYVSRILSGDSLETAIKNASKAGSIAVSRMGAIPSIPYLKEILD